MMLGEYDVEIEHADQHHVVLVIRALHVIVLGRTLCEARQLARAAIVSRDQVSGEGRTQPAASGGYDDSTALVTETRDASP
jgi:hypothetical protein